MKKHIDLDDMVNVNSALVLDIIFKNKEISRREISEKSGLSWGGMTKIVNRLLENGLILEIKRKNASADGRSANVLSMNSEKNLILGLDFNLTGFKAEVVTCAGNPIDSFVRSVRAKDTVSLPEEFLDFAGVILNQFGEENFAAVGIAMQGVTDAETGVSVSFPGISEWKNVHIRDMVQARFGMPTFVEHDPDCLLYPLLNPEEKENKLLFRIDNSIGASVSVGGKLLKAPGILEIAHNIFVPGGKKCVCGACGCLEAYIAPCLSENGPDTDAIESMCLPLACAIKNTSGIFNCGSVCLTGSLMAHRQLFESSLRAHLVSIGFCRMIEFIENSDSAAHGAALIALNKWIQTLRI